MEFLEILLIIVAGIILYFIMKTCEITYHIIPSKNVPTFVLETRKILNASSVHNRYKLREVPNKELADITIELSPRDSLHDVTDKVEYYPGTKKRIWFSYTWQRPKPHISIDETNWIKGVPESGLSLQNYRTYVIQHEFMHALGFDHQPCNEKTAINGVCPVLYQSTRGCPKGFKCGYNITPVDYTKKLDNPYITW